MEIEGIAMVGIDQAFNRVELSPFAFLGEVHKLAVFGKVLLSAPPEMTQVELNLRVRLDAAEASTMAS